MFIFWQINNIKLWLDFCRNKNILRSDLFELFNFEMVEIVKTFANIGLVWHEIYIEADSVRALPTIEIIWLPDMTVKESKERIRWTFRNSGIDLPKRKFVLNLAPSDTKKIWTWFDVPMAFALLLHVWSEKLYHEEKVQNSLFFGELWLDGSIKRINGLLPSVLSAKKKWRKEFFIPAENLYELEYGKYTSLATIAPSYPLISISSTEYLIGGLTFVVWGIPLSLVA